MTNLLHHEKYTIGNRREFVADFARRCWNGYAGSGDAMDDHLTIQVDVGWDRYWKKACFRGGKGKLSYPPEWKDRHGNL